LVDYLVENKSATATPSGEGTLGRIGIFPGEEFNDGPTKH
jgi:hypothetical protein